MTSPKKEPERDDGVTQLDDPAGLLPALARLAAGAAAEPCP